MSTDTESDDRLGVAVSVEFMTGPRADITQMTRALTAPISIVISVVDFNEDRMSFEISVAHLPPEKDRLGDMFTLLGRALHYGTVVESRVPGTDGD